MNDDDTFRLVLLVAGVVFLLAGLYHRARSYTGERLDRWQEGVFILFGLRLTGLVVFVAGMAWMISTPSMAWSAMPIPIGLRWAGVAVALFAGTVWVWTVHTLGKNLNRYGRHPHRPFAGHHRPVSVDSSPLLYIMPGWHGRREPGDGELVLPGCRRRCYRLSGRTNQDRRRTACAAVWRRLRSVHAANGQVLSTAVAEVVRLPTSEFSRIPLRGVFNTIAHGRPCRSACRVAPPSSPCWSDRPASARGWAACRAERDSRPTTALSA